MDRMATNGPLARGIALIALALGILAAPAAASAATFYVDDDPTGTPLVPCTSPAPASACDTINAAITQARGVTGPNTIMVAPGNYPEVLTLNDDDDAGLTIDGAGTSTTGAGSVLQVPTGTNLTVLKSNITIRDFAIQATNFETLFIGSFVIATPETGQRLENVTVELNDQVNGSPAIRLQAANDAVLNDVQVSGDAMWDGGGDANALKVANSTNVTVNDSRLLSNSRTVYARASTLRINRSLVGGPLDLGEHALAIESDLVGGTASLTLDSSLVALGSRGVDVSATMGTATASALIRNSTIDPGLPKGTPDMTGVAITKTGSAGVGLENSIVVGALATAGAGVGSITCTYSDVTHTVVAGIDCPTTPGNPGNNSSNSPASLFVPGGFLGLDWHLLSSSPAIDSGSPGGLGLTESTTDFDGNPRVLDGNFDCVARRDKGAHEITGQSAACPSPSIPGAIPSSGNPSTGATKTRCKKKKKGKSTAVAAKKKGCKKKRK